MIFKIKRQDALLKFPKLPIRKWNSEEEVYILNFQKTIGTYVLTVQAKQHNEHIRNMALQITELAISFGSESLIFQCDLDIAWRHRSHDFKKAKDALSYLASNKIGKRFNGALQVDIAELGTFIIHLCWLVRTNAILPYVYFTDGNQSFFASICQYSNLHISTLTKQADRLLKSVISKTELQLTAPNCPNQSSKPSKTN